MKFKDPESILMFAFRYALGRMTYAPDIVVEEVIKNWKELTPYIKTKIVEEIQDQERRHSLGHDCDKATWYRIVDMYKLTDGKKDED